MITWLNNSLIYGPHITLCLSNEDFQEACEWLKIPLRSREAWMTSDGHTRACVHTFEGTEQGGICCVVCLDEPDEDDTSIDVACRLVHESVHVWQSLCNYIGESAPSREFEAYSIQMICATLMEQYVKVKFNKENSNVK